LIGTVAFIGAITTKIPLKSNSNRGIVDEAIEDISIGIIREIKQTMFVMSLMSYGVSIPFWVGAKKNKMLRNTQLNTDRERFREIEARLKIFQ